MTTVLPINEIKFQFLSALDEHALILLSAPPGAGKSTCLPLWLVESNQFNKIYLLQPRRMAAKSIACFLAQQLGEPVGKTIGYRLRNENKVSTDTKLEVITEGILTQIIQHDPELAGCDLILFDEFHERSVHADFAFALAREVQLELRDNLTLVLMSATLSVSSLTQSLPDAYVIESEGRSFPVDISYQPLKASLATQQFGQYFQWREHAISIIKQVLADHQGSILVFLPGTGDIQYLCKQLAGFIPERFELAPLYGELNLAEQQRAIAAPNTGYKLVLATNIAETSLTIDGINLVIDSGLEKTAIYDNQTLTNKLQQQHIAKASATQRAGRAGRLMPGKCIRLFSQEEFERRAAHHTIEIMHTDLQPLLIEAARWGVTSLSELPLLEKPKSILEDEAWLSLARLKIVDIKRKLTLHGSKVAALACHPRFAHMILSAVTITKQHNISGLVELSCIISAMLEERDVFSKELGRNNADLVSRLRFLLSKPNYGKHKTILMQAKQLLKQQGVIESNGKESHKLQMTFEHLPLEYCGELLALAYPERIAKQKSKLGEYLAYNGKGVELSTEDPLAAETFIVGAVLNQFKQRLYINIAAAVNIERLMDWGIIEQKEAHIAQYDDSSDKIISERHVSIGAIILSRQPDNSQITSAQRAQMWKEVLKKKGLNFLSFSSAVEQLLARWRWVTRHQPHLLFPDCTEQVLLDTLDVWFVPFIDDVYKKSQLLNLDYKNMLLSLLDYEQQKLLSKAAPSSFNGPTGRNCRIRYDENKSPTVSMPMQELYGESQTPSVGVPSTIPLTLELLSPAGRPIQVTQDLSAFWQGSYKEVQKEMKGRYPKHYWPDEPNKAQATNKTKRHLKL